MINIIDDIKEIKTPLINPVLTIGNFDGVHRGHLAIFDKVKQIAKAVNGQSVVITFDPHPVKVMKPENGLPLITSIRQKLKLISDAGIDVVFCISFNKQFSDISARDFVKEILVNRIGVREIVVGYDYTFGRGRQGDIKLLRDMGKEFGFNVQVIEPVHLDKTLVSSTYIGDLVLEGDLVEAKRLLGRDYQISGTVIKGTGRGTDLLGIPTANLRTLDELIPRKGVYAVIVDIADGSYYGVCNIGNNPTFGEKALSIETHLLGFNKDILGKEFTIKFLHRLRGEKKFDSKEGLADQIRKDITRSRKFFGLHEPGQISK
ncbi:MAG TPA: bifunctional riboflavin kinase/FAD synthetase [Desulfatiglandales bacterium]|nr:bifunctional riboflavin kinase/FAD synthetase [Desulfatiglandales bacterium]